MSSQLPIQPPKEGRKLSSLHDTQQRVPGDSPAYYNGDPSNNILAIEILDLLPNPPIE